MNHIMIMVHRFVKENGLSATIYTQTTDVETETNGLMTYDRKINKMGVENVYRANNNIIPPSLASLLRIFIDEYTLNLKIQRRRKNFLYNRWKRTNRKINTIYRSV